MGNKTPPLVIPVVIDSTGVDRGLNNVNNRLRRGVGGGMGGGGGGFGSGGGAALAVAAAAGGLGAGAALARGGGVVGGTTPMVKARGLLPFMGQSRARFRGGGMSPNGPFGRATAAVNEIENLYAFQTAQNENYKGFGDPFTTYAALNESKRLIGQGRIDRLNAVRDRRAHLLGVLRRRNRREALGKMGIPSMSELGGGLMSARGMLGAAGVGVSAAGAVGGTVGFLKNMPSIADPESAVGSPFYGRLRQTTNYFAQQPKRLGLGQGVIAGANVMGGKGALNQLGANTQAGIENIGLTLGMMIEGMLTDPMNTIGSAIGIRSSQRTMTKALMNGLMN